MVLFSVMIVASRHPLWPFSTVAAARMQQSPYLGPETRISVNPDVVRLYFPLLGHHYGRILSAFVGGFGNMCAPWTNLGLLLGKFLLFRASQERYQSDKTGTVQEGSGYFLQYLGRIYHLFNEFENYSLQQQRDLVIGALFSG